MSIHVILPLIFGTLIYALWRGIPVINLHPLLVLYPPRFVIYNLPDGLWFYALLSSVILIWEGKFSKNFLLWFALAVLLSFLSEIFQALKLIPGTFDYKDLIVYFVAGVLSLFQFIKTKKNINNQN